MPSVPPTSAAGTTSSAPLPTASIVRGPPFIATSEKPKSSWKRPADVGRLEAEMMEALAAPREEAPDARGRVERLEQLDLRVAGGEHRGAHALVGERLFLEQRQAEHVAIKPVGVREPLHHDADVMNPSHHVRILLTARTPRHGGPGRRG